MEDDIEERVELAVEGLLHRLEPLHLWLWCQTKPSNAMVHPAHVRSGTEVEQKWNRRVTEDNNAQAK
jgi:hypothetical protein